MDRINDEKKRQIIEEQRLEAGSSTIRRTALCRLCNGAMASAD